MSSSSSSGICSIESFPFNFFASNGTQVPGVLDADGFCIFPDAACAPDDPISACCQAKDSVDNTGDNYMFIAFIFIFLPITFVKRARNESEEAQRARDERMTPSWVKAIPSHFIQNLFKYGLYAYVALQVVVPILMRTSIQQTLSVVNRNTVIAAEAFLVPYNQIFQFIEDIVMVRVNYALASHQKALTNELVHVGLLGSCLAGVVAALVATILGVIPPALTGLTNPGAEVDQLQYPGCDLIAPDSNDVVLPYWLVESWAIPGKQMGMVLTGFMMGAMELSTVGWIGAMSLAMLPIIWFTSNANSSNPILILALGEFASNWTLPVLAIAYLVCPLGAELREHTGVHLQINKVRGYVSAYLRGGSDGVAGTTNNNENDDAAAAPTDEDKEGAGVTPPADDSPEEAMKQPESDLPDDEAKATAPDAKSYGTIPGETSHAPPPAESTKALLMEGLKIMFMDVAVQCCISLSIYLALARSASDAYQLTALQSALPTYGIAYALGMGVVMKVVGPQLLAKGNVEMFAKFARITVVCSFLLVPLILGSALPFTSGLAFSYGGNACGYAQNSECVAFFTNVFGANAEGGTYSLSFTFDVFPLGACVEAIFFVLRSILLTLVDLDYMVKCTVLAIIVYIPAIVVASVAEPFGGKAISYFVAMYIPQVVLCVMFLGRIHVVLGRMLAGGTGTWDAPRAKNSSSFRIIPEMPQ